MNKRTLNHEQTQELLRKAESAYYKNKRSNSVTFNAIGEQCLLSYSSVVMSIDTLHRTITFYPHHDYSPTTNKHVCAFIDNVLGDRVYAKERRQAIESGELTIIRSNIMFTYTVMYCDYQPRV